MENFNWLTFLGVPQELQDIAKEDAEFIRLSASDVLSDECQLRLHAIRKLHGIKYNKRPVWVRDNPNGPLYLKRLTPFEHYQHYLQAGFGVPNGYRPIISSDTD